jgi:shikimate kinase
MTNPKSAKKFNIVLIGYRAVGKTTVGAQVAHRLGRPLIDFDAILEQEAGESIPNLVSREGWPEFRRREKAVVQRYASQEGLVLATGGGVILDQENTARLKATGKLIWLKASSATIKARLSCDAQQTATRPGLTAKGTLGEIDEVLASREPLYQEAATVSLAVDTESAAEVAQRIVDLVRTWEQENQ